MKNWFWITYYRESFRGKLSGRTAMDPCTMDPTSIDHGVNLAPSLCRPQLGLNLLPGIDPPIWYRVYSSKHIVNPMRSIYPPNHAERRTSPTEI